MKIKYKEDIKRKYKEDINMLTDSAIMGTISFVFSMAGVKFISTVDVIQAMQIAVVPGVAAFFTELIIERKRRQH